MLRQVITRIVISVALLCASVAWSGWVFLHSVGDPHRAERIATAILADPAARAEVAAPLADQIVTDLGLPPTYKDTIRTTVADVLGDPNIVGNFIAAFGSAQANALGVNDPRPTTIDAGALVNAVRDRLALTQPALAALIPNTTASIDLPKVQSPVISRLRSLASTWTVYLAIVAIVLIGVLMGIGDRRRVLRSYGLWAILTGAFWAIGPRVAPWFAHRAAPEADALVGATVTAVAGPITMAATVLVISGIVALVVRYTVLAEKNPLDLYAPQAPAPGQATVMQPVMAGHRAAPPYALTRTDQVPVQAYAPGQQWTHAPTGPYGQQHAATSAQPAVQHEPHPTQHTQPVAGYFQPPAPRSTPIPESQDDLARNSAAIPLLITPLDLPTAHDQLFRLTDPTLGPAEDR